MRKRNITSATTIRKSYENTALKITRTYIRYAKNIESVVIGGSLARKFSDKDSDIEMYIYYSGDMVPKDSINQVLSDLNAKLVRFDNVHWYHPSWGYHTCFKTNGIKVELGYRNVDEVTNRIELFLKGNILAKPSLHDAPFGHYESGLASCIVECKPIVDNGFIESMKKKLANFPEELKIKLIDHYFEDCRTVTKVKVAQAISRDDDFNFHASLALALRGLIITLFTINETYYPGDKWNSEYIRRFIIVPKNFQENIKKLISTPDVGKKNKKIKLLTMLTLIKSFEAIFKRLDYGKNLFKQNEEIEFLVKHALLTKTLSSNSHLVLERLSNEI